MRLWENLANWIQRVEYGFMLQRVAALPIGLAEMVFRLRGTIAALVDYDWRALALGRRYIRKSTYLAMKDIIDGAGAKAWNRATRKRFVHNSLEEWKACLFSCQRHMKRIYEKSTIEGIDRLKELQAHGRGVVMVSMHFDSFCMGMVLFGMSGIVTHVVNTEMIEDQRIHPAVRRFFATKYRMMERYMHGRMPYYQRERAYFYDVLKKGEMVILLGDIPGSKSDVFIPMFGRKFRMPLGAWHMAKATGALVGAYVCLHLGGAKYRVVCLPPTGVDKADPVRTMAPIYAFLQAWVKKMPERWVAADILPGFEVLSS